MFEDLKIAAAYEIEQLHAELEKLRQASVGWQPIETAPKEGAFLVTGGKMYDDLCFVDDSYDVALVNAAERGTRYEVRDTCYYSMWVVGATHWMPLPLPPKEC